MANGEDTYGTVLRDSELVAHGKVVQVGSRPGKLDAHVRSNMLILASTDPPIEFRFNDEDAEILLRVAAVAAREADISTLDTPLEPVGERL